MAVHSVFPLDTGILLIEFKDACAIEYSPLDHTHLNPELVRRQQRFNMGNDALT